MKSKAKKLDYSQARFKSYLRIKIINSTNMPLLFSQLRQSVPTNYYKEITKLAFSLNRHREIMLSLGFPKSVNILKSYPTFTSVSLENEIRWASAYLSLFLDSLKSFCSIKDKYESLFILGNYDECKNILDNIYTQFGFSFWYIKNNLVLRQVTQGLESQKSFSKDIIEKCNRRGLVPFITQEISYRTEPTVSPNIFREEFENILDKLNISNSAKAYLIYHLTPRTEWHEDDIAGILRYESLGSIIDYYEAFLTVSRIILSQKNTETFRALLKSLYEINDTNIDPNISILFDSLNEKLEAGNHFEKLTIKAFDNYLIGNDEETILFCKELLNKYPTDLINSEIIARTNLKIGKNEKTNTDHLSGQIINLMSRIIAKNSDSLEATSELYKHVWMYAHNNWSRAILAFLYREQAPLDIDLSTLLSYVSLSSNKLHPNNIQYLQYNNFKQKYLSIFENNFIEYIRVCIYIKTCCNYEEPINLPTDILEEELWLVEANNCINNKKFEQALRLANKLQNSKIVFYKNKSIQIESMCLLKLEKIDQCIDYITTTYINNPMTKYIMPIESTLKRLDRNARKKLSSNISLSIIYDIYTKNFKMEYENLRNYAYEDFLLSNNINRPSQLINFVNLIELNKLIYYLRYICIESVMYTSSPIFKSSQDIAKERIEVCRLLCELDKTNIDEYQNEIKDIYRRLNVKMRTQEIEKSKIYVNLNGLKEIAFKSLKDKFTRYLSFVKNGLDHKTLSLIELVKDKLSDRDIEGFISLSLPQNEMNDLFESIIFELTNNYVSNTQYGLDVCLSVRIRHGTFIGQLRSRLEAANLITQRDATSGEYKQNKYWLDKLKLHTQDEINNLNKSFSEFSKQFDGLMQTMVSEWIQVKTTKEGVGLFDFTVAKVEAAMFAGWVNKDTSFDDFVEQIHNYLTKRLDRNLDIVRNKIRFEAKKKASELITNLETNIINHLGYTTDTGELINAINNTQTNMQIAFDRVIEWFHTSEPSKQEPFTIEDAINISVNSMKTMNPEFENELIVSSELRDLPIYLGKLPSFVDMLFIIFGNIIKHSSVRPPKATINVDLREGLFLLRITNEIDEKVSNPENVAIVNKIKIALKEGEYGKSIITEGGTGFYKINKILTYDVQSNKSKLDFGFIGNKQFYVELGIGMQILEIIDTTKGEVEK